MNCWEILGVPNTIIVEQLQIVYYNKLRQYSSIGNKAKCLELKEAYEEALNTIKNDQGKRIITKFLEEVDDLYSNFANRLKLENWIAILNKYDTKLEMSPQLSEELLRYLQSHQHLPHKVWEYLDSTFKWTYYKNELYIKFSKNYIDFILRYAKKELYVRYNKFDLSNTSIDYDQFIDQIIKATDALAKRDLKLVQEHINGAKKIYSSHTDLKILFIKYKKLKNELDRCIELCDFILSVDSSNKIVYSIRGDSYLKKNDLERAYNDFKCAMELEPKSNEDYYSLGFVCFLLKKPTEAKKYIEYIKDDDLYLSLKDALLKDINNLTKDMELPKIIAGINKEPINLDLYRQAYDVYYGVGDYEAIYKLLNNLSILKPLDVDLHLKLGKVCLKLDKLDEALLALYNATSEDADNFEAVALLGDVLVRLFKYDEALGMYNKALAIEPNNSEVLLKISETLFNLNRYQEAMEFCNILDKKNRENNHCNSEKLSNLIITLLIEMKSYETALIKCQIILNVNPNSVEACLNKVKIYNRLEKYDETINLLNNIPGIASEDNRFLCERAQTLYYLGNIDETEKICKKLIDEKYASFEPQYLLGMVCNRKKDYKNAAQYYSLALEKEPQRDVLLLAIGINYKDLGKDDDALKYINKAIEINELYVEAYTERIILYMKRGQYEEASIDVEKCLSLKESAMLYVKSGEILENLNKNPMSCYNKAISIDDKYIDGYLNRGIYYAKVGKHSSAFEDFDKAISINAKSPFAYMQRGNIYLKSGKSNEAIEEYNKAINLGYDDYEIYMKIGDCYRATNNYQKAIENCTLAIKRNSGITDSYRIRGLSLYNISDIKGALNDFNVCISSNQLNKSAKAGVYKYIAYCYGKLNDMGKAMESFKEAISLDPNNIHLKEEYELLCKQNSGIGKLKGVFGRKK